MGEEKPLKQAKSSPECEMVLSDDGENQPHMQYDKVGDTASSESTERVPSPKSMQSGQEREALIEEEELEEEEDWEVVEDRRFEAFLGRSEVDIRRERAAIAKKITEEDERMHIFRLDAVFYQRLEAIRKREETSTPDGTLTVLLDGYEWLHRGGVLPLFRPKAFDVGIPCPGDFWRYTCMIRQTTYERLAAMRPVEEGKAIEHVLEMAIARLLDTYEWLMEGGLAELVSERMAASQFYVRGRESKREKTELGADGQGDEASLDEAEGDSPSSDPLSGWWQMPAWWQVRWIDHPDVIVEKARLLLTSNRWEELVVGLTVTTGRCLLEVLKTGVFSPKSKYVLGFAAYSQEDGMKASFEIPALVESALILNAWQQVKKLKDCHALSAQEVCKRYRPMVVQSAVQHFAHLIPHDDGTIDWYTPLLRLIYARIAARYYSPPGKVTEQFLAYVQHGTWSSQSRSGAYGCAACWQPTYHYEISDGKGNIDGRIGLKLNQEGVELLEICRDEDEE